MASYISLGSENFLVHDNQPYGYPKHHSFDQINI